MRKTKVIVMNTGKFLTVINLWIDDHDHIDTCYWMISNVRPTQRQLRKFKKEAKLNFRKGTRSPEHMYVRGF